MKYVGQLMFYAAFAAVIGALSVWPVYHIAGPQQAMISVTFSHAGERVGECHVLTQAELNDLPPNMRKPTDCPRERHPVYIELRTADELLFASTLQPSGLWNDGKSNVYQRIKIMAGNYSIFVGMNDSSTKNRFDYQLTQNLVITPGSNVVVSFDGLNNQFVIE